MPRVASAEMADAYLSGVSIRAIAAAWMMPEPTVRARLRYAGVPMRRPGPQTKAIASMLAEIAAMQTDDAQRETP